VFKVAYRKKCQFKIAKLRMTFSTIIDIERGLAKWKTNTKAIIAPVG
jgi:hypothetical protein